MTHSVSVRAFLSLCVAVGLALLPPAIARAQSADSFTGLWLTEGGKSKVQVYKTGNTYSGKIVWLKTPKYVQADLQGSDNDMTPAEFKKILGKPKVDRHNPDASKRNRPIIGMSILSDFKYSGDGVWEAGHIYNPEDGKTYKCKITMDGKNKLDVRGFVGISLFGKSQTWTRAK